MCKNISCVSITIFTGTLTFRTYQSCSRLDIHFCVINVCCQRHLSEVSFLFLTSPLFRSVFSQICFDSWLCDPRKCYQSLKHILEMCLNSSQRVDLCLPIVTKGSPFLKCCCFHGHCPHSFRTPPLLSNRHCGAFFGPYFFICFLTVPKSAQTILESVLNPLKTSKIWTSKHLKGQL